MLAYFFKIQCFIPVELRSPRNRTTLYKYVCIVASIPEDTSIMDKSPVRSECPAGEKSPSSKKHRRFERANPWTQTLELLSFFILSFQLFRPLPHLSWPNFKFSLISHEAQTWAKIFLGQKDSTRHFQKETWGLSHQVPPFCSSPGTLHGSKATCWVLWKTKVGVDFCFYLQELG